ncbi:hypothetical protein GCM10027203_79940 [Nonomuraea fastidiosa]
MLRWYRRRWCCDQASCPRQTFTEQVPQIPARSRLTRRLRQAAGDGGRTVMQAARDHRLSWSLVACRVGDVHRARSGVLPAQPGSIVVLGIDEVRRGRPRWVPEEAAGTWTTAGDR